MPLVINARHNRIVMLASTAKLDSLYKYLSQAELTSVEISR